MVWYYSGADWVGSDSKRRPKERLLAGSFFCPNFRLWYNRGMKKKDSKLTNAGVSAYNKPKRTPGHKTKSHVVVAKENGKTKTIRFGQQGVSGSPKTKGESDAAAARRKSFKARHSSNIEKGKMSAAYWSNKTKW